MEIVNLVLVLSASTVFFCSRIDEGVEAQHPYPTGSVTATAVASIELIINRRAATLL